MEVLGVVSNDSESLYYGWPKLRRVASWWRSDLEQSEHKMLQPTLDKCAICVAAVIEKLANVTLSVMI